MKTRINLYSPTMLPPKPRLTLASLSLVALLLIVVMGSAIGVQKWRVSQIEAEREIARVEQQRLADQVLQLSTKLAQQRPSPQLIAAVDQANAKLSGLEQIKDLLAQDKFLIEPGFSNLMNDLSVAADRQVWLQQFDVASGQLRLAGMAQRAAAVPAWIDKLGAQKSLQGRALSKLMIDGEGTGPIRFEASHAFAAEAKAEGGQ